MDGALVVEGSQNALGAAGLELHLRDADEGVEGQGQHDVASEDGGYDPGGLLHRRGASSRVSQANASALCELSKYFTCWGVRWSTRQM